MLCSTLRKCLLAGVSLTALAGISVLMAPVAKAADAGTGNFTVNASVIQTCTVSGSIAFGNYDGTTKDTTGTINITCSSPTEVQIGLDAGSGTCAAPVRAMSDGTNSLTYGLYRSAADRTSGTAWGCDPPNNTQSLTPAQGGDSVTVYGRIPSGQFKPVGSYSQDVTITVTY
ncbi:spore coat U domain-containing protein [Thermosynechococcaceae cyanobacterium Okahandja]